MNVVPKLNEGGQTLFPTLPDGDGFRPKQGSVMGQCWVVTVQKRDLRRRKEKAAPLDIKVGGEDMGRALNSSPKANFRGEQRGLQSMLRPRVVVETGGRAMAWKGGYHLRLKNEKETKGADKAPHTPSSSPTGCDLKPSHLL